MKIFIVDDSYDARIFVQRTLSEAGYSDLILAASGEEALDKLGQEGGSPSGGGILVLLDIGLPKKDGIEICREMTQHFEVGRLLVLMVTVRDKSKYFPLALEAGAHDFIKKPIDQGELLARVQSAANSLKLYTLYREQQEILEQCYLDLQRSYELGQEVKSALPFCVTCQKVESQPSKWESLHKYLESQSGIQFKDTQCIICHS